MRAYFTINSKLYSTDKIKIMTTLNKMSKGRGIDFSEMWYDRMSNATIDTKEKTFNKFAKNFETTFYPFDIKATAHSNLAKLAQKTFREEDDIRIASSDQVQRQQRRDELVRENTHLVLDTLASRLRSYHSIVGVESLVFQVMRTQLIYIQSIVCTSG